VKGAKAREVLGSSLPELYVVTDDANDVRLLLDGVSEIAGVGHGWLGGNLSGGIVRQRVADRNIAAAGRCGKTVDREHIRLRAEEKQGLDPGIDYRHASCQHIFCIASYEREVVLQGCGGKQPVDYRQGLIRTS